MPWGHSHFPGCFSFGRRFLLYPSLRGLWGLRAGVFRRGISRVLARAVFVVGRALFAVPGARQVEAAPLLMPSIGAASRTSKRRCLALVRSVRASPTHRRVNH
jgi:hypothetical protein